MQRQLKTVFVALRAQAGLPGQTQEAEEAASESG